MAGRYDAQLSITLVSKFFLKLTGFTYDELMATTGGSLFNLVAPEDRDQFLVASFEDNDSPRELIDINQLYAVMKRWLSV